MSKKNIGLFTTFFSLLALSSSMLSASHTVEATIERDNYGMPTISGGGIPEIADAIGHVQAEDRLWQMFLIVQVANGRASQYFGPDFLDSDIMQHQINYTDDQVQSQINQYFTHKTKVFYQNFTFGINQHIAYLNTHVDEIPFELRAIGFSDTNPIPQFSIYDIIRANQFVLQQFSLSSIPDYQLDNASDLNVLITNFGSSAALQIFSDIDPTTKQVKSPFTIVPNHDCKSKSRYESHDEATDILLKTSPSVVAEAKHIANKYTSIRKFRKKFGIPGLGSNGQVISAEKSASCNPMIRVTTQPNFDQPSDFYQIRVDRNRTGFRGNFFTIPTLPITPSGVFNDFGVAVQVGHLPANDFLYEPAANAVLQRTDIIQVLGDEPVALPIYRSTSGGWVLTNPVIPDSTILTLRSVFIDKQLRALNTFIEFAFARDLDEFKGTLLNPAWQSDILLIEGQYVDSGNNIAAFHMGGWTSLPPIYDHRLPQGIPQNPAPSNVVYSYQKIARSPLFDANTPQGYYVSWNSLFKQGAAGFSDTVFPVGVNRGYWLNEYIANIDKLSFDDLKNISLRQYVANNNTAFDNSGPDEDADLFVILFKKRFFKAVRDNPTPERLQAIAFLENFRGDWFDGDLNHIINTPDVSDKRILASVWLNAVANAVLNPYLNGTTREIPTATPLDTVPTFNQFGVKNELVHQGNLLSRIFNLACDNTVFYNGWLTSQPPVDQIIVQGLDFALATLGGMNNLPWGAGKRGIYEFENALLGPVQSMLMCNIAAFTLVAEFTKHQINMASVLALGESGLILGNPEVDDPIFTQHCFDQQPLFTQLQLRYNPPFKLRY